MIHSRISLSEEEILLLLEGDLSDLDLDTSDVEEEIENAQQQDPATLDIQFLQGMDLDMVEILDPQANDEDDVPLASRLLAEPNLAPSHSAQKIQCDTHWDLWWRMKDIEEVDTSCNAVFSDPPGDELTPLQYFGTMCSDDIIQNLVEQSNLYCTQKTGASLDTNVREIEKYIGINILASVVKMPSCRMYWAEATRFSPIADSMPRNRFDKLRNYLHVNEMKRREDPDYDKLFKVRPFVDKIKQGFSIIEPEEYHSVDELIIPFKGNSSLKQYVKSKPHKWGIKVFACAGSSGIVYDFEIYRGKGTVHNDTGLGISGDIVIRLVEGLPKYKNFKVFTDSWFTSYHLISALKNYGILAVGTVRPTRLNGCNPKADSELKKQERGSYGYRTETERSIIALNWYDNKSVVLASYTKE
ncbi:piggyBac transposable element-derived protein 2-like [Schistocerca cancellata]|uniref:piggyBac transposable element-derived protein 2-like n=1 Tax=Schistocerca cancellata TaxID=274614 RepID=UPI0021173E6C|nr:piggyBac transposable element-derived protein 2-like [Schistocerca cancellata]